MIVHGLVPGFYRACGAMSRKRIYAPIAHLVRGKLRGQPIADLSPLMTDPEWLAWFSGSPAELARAANREPYTGECFEDGEP